MSLTIATWNVNSIKVRLPQVLSWLQQHSVDILALQEIKTEASSFPSEAFQKLGYHVAVSGQKTYNGVAVISRYSIEILATHFPADNDPSKRILFVETAGKRLLNLYCPNGGDIDGDKFQYKLAWFRQLIDFTRQQLEQTQSLILLGDFNIAPNPDDVHNETAWQNSVLTHPQVRDIWRQLCELGLQDSYHLFPRAEAEFSWWDYRSGCFAQNHGLRIDHILLSHAMVPDCCDCHIDKAPRQQDRPSDHAPVVVNLLAAVEH